MLGKTAAQLVAEARARVETVSPAQVAAELRRSAADTLHQMGYGNVAHLDGGLEA